ncbi:MAG: Clp protease N-terminal domain-containing protein, partial [Phycisphaerae bacterium]
MMPTQKLTVRATQALQKAEHIASASGHPRVMPLHLLHALLNEDPGGVIAPLLKKLGAPLERLVQTTESELSRLPKVSGGQLSADASLEQVLTQARADADAMKDEYVSTEHLLLALSDV